MKVFLIGLPGSGKSTLGKALAEELKTSFVDLDAEIEKQTGNKISDIFEEQGETYFRKIESEQLKKWINSSEDFVMATGGGTPCFFDHMNLMNGSGKSIFLDVPEDEISRRINTLELSERPLFAAIDPGELKDKLESMLLSRRPFYQQAQMTFSGEAITAKELKNVLSGS